MTATTMTVSGESAAPSLDRIAAWLLFAFVASLQFSIAAANVLLTAVLICWAVLLVRERRRHQVDQRDGHRQQHDQPDALEQQQHGDAGAHADPGAAGERQRDGDDQRRNDQRRPDAVAGSEHQAGGGGAQYQHQHA